MKFPKFKKKTLLWLGIGAVGLILVILGFSGGAAAPVFDIYKVERQDVQAIVSVTGKLLPAKSVDLAFERSGRVARVNADVGQKVAVGMVLAGQDAGDLAAERNQALARLASAKARLSQQEAALSSEQSRLEELKQGPTAEELALAEAKVSRAVTALGDARAATADAIIDAYFKSEDAVRARLDPLYFGPRTQSPQIQITITDSQLETDIEWQRFLLESVINTWQGNNLSAPEAQQNLAKVSAYLTDMALALNYAAPTPAWPQATLDSYKTTVATARANINSAISALLAGTEKESAANANLAVAQGELAVTKAGSTPQAIATQEAKVRQSEALLMGERANVQEAEASLQRAEALLAKASIRAPFSGIVTFRNLEPGEIVSANTKVYSLLADAGLEIEAFVPETDIAQIKLGDLASFSVDALSSAEVFGAKVLKVDPVETVLEGVTTYKVTFTLAVNDPRLKSGMTADLDILTAEAKDVLALPKRVIKEKDNQSFVLIKAVDPKQAPSERVIEVGLVGSEGQVEIKAGLTEGEEVVVESAAPKRP